jgi:hypothetical protein
MLTVVLDRRQEATLKVKAPAPSLETGSHPKTAGVTGSPRLSLQASAPPGRHISTHSREPRHAAAATRTTANPQPRTQFSGQRDRRGDKA